MNQQLTPSYGLTTTQLAEIRQLEAECNQFEGLRIRLNWLSLESRPVDQINDFLLYEAGRLIGYLALYGFNQKEVEVSVMTHPQWRRQGVFKQLLAAAKQELAARHIPDLLFMCERASAAGAICLKASGAQYDFSEYKMNLRQMVPAVEFPASLSLRPATPEDLPLLGQMDELCFGVAAEIAQNWLGQDLGDPAHWVLVAELDGVPIGKITVLLGQTEAYIAGVCLWPQYRGQGYGKAILTRTVAQIGAQYNGVIALEVACSNENALTLYRNCGFEVVTVYDYYRLPVTQGG